MSSRPRLHREEKSSVDDLVATLLRKNEDQTITIAGLQKALREVREEMKELKVAHQKQLLKYARVEKGLL